MKTIKFLTMAVAALMMAACSSDELESVAKKAGGMVPLEIVPDVSQQTRAAQITATNLTAFIVDVTGKFVDASGTEYTDPVLSMTKSGGDWSYTYTDATHATPADGTLYWLLEGQTATFSAHIMDAGTAVDQKSAQQDVVGAYASKTFNGTDNPGTVSLTFKHAVAKMQFKARVEAAASGSVEATIDIRQVAVRKMKYDGTYAIPTSTNETGVLTAGTDKGDLFTDMRTGTAFISKDDAAATDLGSVFMLPQDVTADALGTTPWNDAYIAVLAQVRIKDGSAQETMLFPKVGAVDNTSYAWLAVPMPAEFTAMEAHHKYVFTLHFSADALGKIDPTQDPYTPAPNNPDVIIDPDDPTHPGGGGFIDPDDAGKDIEPEGKSASPVIVTVQNIYDFEDDGAFDVNEPPAAAPAWDGDLSMVDCAGNVRTSMSTANCYMVHTAGDYKLPLVYGNAIKDDAANTVAYNPGGTASETFSTNFVNHAGNAITAPWIKDNGITVTQAELLWQDAEGLITAVGISGDYQTLTVGKDAATQEGNAVIAAKAGETIVWSWHIWVTKQTFATLTDINTGSHTYSVTPVNLGWVGEATSTTGYNTFYQWGRKDAFIPSTGTGNTNHTVYDISNATVTGFSHTDDNSVTIGGNIQHPTVHYQNTSNYSLCDTQFYNMWDAQQTSNAENTAAATVKTVYDLCPPGFCVPTVGLYYYIKSGGSLSSGYTYNGVFFPASGYRYNSSGNLNGVGTYGSCWSATPSGGTYGRYFVFDYSSCGLSSNLRAVGCPVRAVAE